MAAAEHVEREVAVAVVVSMKEPPFLLAMQRIVGRIEVKNDLPRASGRGSPGSGLPGPGGPRDRRARGGPGCVWRPGRAWDTRRPQNALGVAATLGLTASWRPSTGPIRR
jgi:hypothetical protein